MTKLTLWMIIAILSFAITLLGAILVKAKEAHNKFQKDLKKVRQDKEKYRTSKRIGLFFTKRFSA